MIMDTVLFNMIKEIAERNGSIEYYPLETFEDNGETCLTCNGWLFAETSSEWLFSDVSDDEALTLLRAFVSKDNHCTFEILRHFARLMAVKGSLVCDLMDPIISSTDWGSYASPTSLLAYLAVKSDGVDWILRLLDVVPNDGRAGLFTACWYCEDVHVQEKLVVKFEEWTKGPTWGSGDGEDSWLECFLGKWITQESFPYERLKNLVLWHFNHKYRFM